MPMKGFLTFFIIRCCLKSYPGHLLEVEVNPLHISSQGEEAKYKIIFKTLYLSLCCITRSTSKNIRPTYVYVKCTYSYGYGKRSQMFISCSYAYRNPKTLEIGSGTKLLFTFLSLRFFDMRRERHNFFLGWLFHLKPDTFRRPQLVSPRRDQKSTSFL